MLSAQRYQRGSAAVAAVAVIVIVGLLGSALVGMVRTDSVKVTSVMQRTQAYYAADAGVEWACKQNATTPGTTAFGGGTFQVTSVGDIWTSTGSDGGGKVSVVFTGQTPAEPLSTGFDYLSDSRPTGWSSVSFLVINTSNQAVTFNRLKVEWVPGIDAYFDPVDVNVIGYRDYNAVYSAKHDRWANGDVNNLSTSVTVPAHRTMAVSFDRFVDKAWANGSPVTMDARQFTVTMYNNSTQVGQVQVGLPLQ